MRYIKTLIAIFLFFTLIGSSVVSGAPTPPNEVYGYITDSGDAVNDAKVEFKHDGNVLVSTTTSSDGYYEVKISGLEKGDKVSMYVDGSNTGESITYTSGASVSIDHSGDYISDDTGSDSDGDNGGGFGGAPSPGKSPEPKKITVEVNNNTTSASVGTVQENQQVTVEIQSQDGKQSSNVNQISFKSNSAAQNVEISVKNHGNNKPGDIPSAAESDSETVHSYMEINHDNLNNENIAEATITFSVEKSWLEENNKNPSDVGVKRFHGEDWENIEVNQFDDTDTHYVYKANTPGFSYYSIYLKGTSEDTTGGTSEDSEDAKEPSGSSDQTGDDKEGIPGLTIFGVVALIALVAVAAVTALKRQQK